MKRLVLIIIILIIPCTICAEIPKGIILVWAPQSDITHQEMDECITVFYAIIDCDCDDNRVYIDAYNNISSDAQRHFKKVQPCHLWRLWQWVIED